jgi:DNA polymerase III subunit delta
LDSTSFLRLVGRGELPPVLLLHGPDAQLLDDALTLVTRGLFPDPSSAAFGREVLDGRETDAQAVVSSAMTLPLLGGVRLVVVRHAQALGPRNAAALGDYAHDPNPATRLVLLADEGLRASRDRRADHWLVQTLPAAAIVDLPARRGRELAGWLRERAATEGLEVSEEGAKLLLEWAGEDGAVLLNEIRKAALAGGADNRSVGVREVGAIVGEHRLADVFELTRAVQRRDMVLALKTLERLLATEEPMRMLVLLARDLRVAWTVRTLVERGQSSAEIARALRLPPAVVETLSRGDPAPRLAEKLARCWDVERRVKSSGEPRAELTLLVADLCAER